MGRPPKKTLPADLNEILNQVGSAIQYYRERKGISQAELARLAEVSNTTLNEIETRKFRDIRLSTLLQISDALDVSLHQLFLKSDIDLHRRDQTQLLKASETISRIARKLEDE